MLIRTLRDSLGGIWSAIRGHAQASPGICCQANNKSNLAAALLDGSQCEKPWILASHVSGNGFKIPGRESSRRIPTASHYWCGSHYDQALAGESRLCALANAECKDCEDLGTPKSAATSQPPSSWRAVRIMCLRVCTAGEHLLLARRHMAGSCTSSFKCHVM